MYAFFSYLLVIPAICLPMLYYITYSTLVPFHAEYYIQNLGVHTRSRTLLLTYLWEVTCPTDSLLPLSHSGMVLQTAVNVDNRPITQQGLSGLRTGTASSRGPGRRFEDKSFYVGELRRKMGELQTEIARIAREVEAANEEQSTFLAYDKRVKELAVELTGTWNKWSISLLSPAGPEKQSPNRPHVLLCRLVGEGGGGREGGTEVGGASGFLTLSK